MRARVKAFRTYINSCTFRFEAIKPREGTLKEVETHWY